MSSKNVGTYRDEIEEPDPNFTGRKSEKNEFKKAIKAVIGGDISELKKTKRMFNIYGEGGMGKTSLLLEYLSITRRSGLHPIYIDIRPETFPIKTLTEFLIVLRHRLKQLPKNRMSGNPFREFDNYLRTYLGLEKKKRNNEESSEENAVTQLMKDSTSAGLRIVEEVFPPAKTFSTIFGRDKVDDLAFSIIDSIGQIGKEAGIREKLLQIFHNEDDVDFYLDNEDKFLDSMLKAIRQISKEYPLVLMFDSYERLFGIDEYIRERLLKDFPRNTILVFSGRNSLKESGNPDWRKFFHYFEMGEFTEADCYTYMRKHGIRKRIVLESVWKFTQGVPFAVALAVEAIKNLSHQEEAVQIFQDNKNARLIKKREELIQEIIREVASRFMMLVSDENKMAIYSCAVLGRITKGAFEYLIGRKISRGAFNKLNQYSFIRRYGVNFLFHNTARTYILQNLYSESPNGDFKELNSKAFEYYEQVLANIDLDLENKYDNEEWQQNALNKLYHLLRFDKKRGLEEFYNLFADALWEVRIELCVNLVELARQPLQINIMGLDFLDTFCTSYQSKNYLEAQKILMELLKFKVDSKFYYQMIYDTLGDLNEDDKLNKPSDAIEHFEQAVKYFRDLGNKEREATTLLNIAECKILLNRLDDAIQNLRDCLAIRNVLGISKSIAYTQWRLGSVYQLLGKYQDAIEELTKSHSLYIDLDNEIAISVAKNIANNYRLLGEYKTAVKKYKEIIEQVEKGENKPLLAICYYEISLALNGDKFYKEAIEHLEKSLLIYKELEQKENMAYILNQIGITYRLLGENQEALVKYEEALTLYERVGDNGQMASVLYGMGLALRNINEYAKALESFNKCQYLCIELDYQKDIASLDKEIGETFRNWGKSTEAIESYNKALEKFEKTNNKAKMAGVWHGLGFTHRQIEEYETAIDEFQKSCSLCNELGSLGDVAYLYNEIAVTYRLLIKYEQAIEYYEMAIGAYEKNNNKEEIADIYNELGATYLEWDKYSSAVTALEKSRSFFQQLNQSKKVSELWSSIGYIYQKWEKYPEALECYKQSYDSHNESDEKTELAKMHLNFGATYSEWQKFPDAIQNFGKCHELYKELNLNQEAQEANEAILYNWLGRSYLRWGQYELALENFGKANILFYKFENKDNSAGVLANIGITYQTWGKYPDAIESLDKSIKLYEELDQKEDVGAIWNIKGALYRTWGKYEEAIQCHKSSLQISKNKKDNIFVAHLRIGRAYHEWGDYTNALAAYENCLKICQELSWEAGYAYTLHRMGLSLAKLGRKQDAITNAKESVELAIKMELTEAEADCHTSLVTIHATFQELDKSRECYEHAIEKYLAIGDLFDLADVSVILGNFEAEFGNHDHATELFNKAINIYREYRRIPQLGKALAEFGKLLKNIDPEKAKIHLEESVELLRDSFRETEANEVQKII